MRIRRLQHQIVHMPGRIRPAADRLDALLGHRCLQLLQTGDDGLIAGTAGTGLGGVFRDDHMQHASSFCEPVRWTGYPRPKNRFERRFSVSTPALAAEPPKNPYSDGPDNAIPCAFRISAAKAAPGREKMYHKKPITLLVLIISVLAVLAAGTGIYSAEVAPQGIAQDYVTLFPGLPFLWISLAWARKGSLRGRFLLAGVLGYFFVTYLFYLMMGMYNALFLVYAA